MAMSRENSLTSAISSLTHRNACLRFISATSHRAAADLTPCCCGARKKSSNLGIEKRDFKVIEFLFLKTLD